MNKIYWDKDKITLLTDKIEAIEHKHWAIQIFLSLDDELNIRISNADISGRGVIVNQNIVHSFSSEQLTHISIIIDPTSNLSDKLKKLINRNEYYIFDNEAIKQAQQFAKLMLKDNDITTYNNFVFHLNSLMDINEEEKLYDERIQEIIQYIKECNCNEHSISSFSEKVSLSNSRLSHLFKEQVGVPLKCYIQYHQMQKAFLALLSGKNITEAAIDANFDSPSHFAAVTKRIMGMPASISLKDSVFLKVY